MNQRVRARASAQTMRNDLEGKIRSGVIEPGAKLPTERDLAEQFRLSRNTVRHVLDLLSEDGLIERHVGRGTFARGNAAARGRAPVGAGTMIDKRSINPEEVMEARMLIEPLLARLVVSRATDRELEKLQQLVAAGGSAPNMSEFDYWDNRFHRAVALASKNKFLIQIVEGIHATRQSQAWSGLSRRGMTDDRRRQYQADHEKIADALALRDGIAAEEAIVEHLQHVRRNLLLV